MFSKLIRTALVCLISCGLTPITQAAEEISPGQAKRLEAIIIKNTQNKVKVESIRKTPIQGLYQVDSDGEVFYIDESGRYGLVGAALVDMQKQVDLTAAHIERKQTIDFSTLPLQYAIKEVRGTGQRKFATFEDPTCPICKVFAKFIDQLDNVTVYKFMFPVIDPSSVSFARVAWCSSDKGAVWRSIMAGAKPTGRQDCDINGLLEILKTGERLQIKNTPTVFLSSGKRLVGATPPEQFIAELDATIRQ